jgi:hypothetical protein
MNGRPGMGRLLLVYWRDGRRRARAPEVLASCGADGRPGRPPPALGTGRPADLVDPSDFRLNGAGPRGCASPSRPRADPVMQRVKLTTSLRPPQSTWRAAAAAVAGLLETLRAVPGA